MSNQSVERDTPFPQYLCERHLWKQTEWWESEEKLEKKRKKKLGRGWVSNQGPRIFSFRRLQTLKSDSVIFISLARISSDNAHIYTHSYFIYAQRPLKFSGRTFIFTARNTRKTENLLFVFWSCPSSAQKYLLFQFSDARFEILSIFCPWYMEKMILKKKVSATGSCFNSRSTYELVL